MSGYTVQGYLVALRVRTAKTILFEWPSDKTFVDLLLSDLDCSDSLKRSAIVVDTSSMIRAGIGAREIVEQVHGLASGLRDVFCGLVDREFRHFQLPEMIDEQPVHHIVDGNLFWTRGHSVENYLFAESNVIAFLRLSHAHVLNGALASEIRRVFPDVLRWAAAVSVAAYQSSTIERMRGLSRTDHWSLDAGGDLQFLTTDLLNALAVRGVTIEQQTVFTDSLNKARGFAQDPLLHEGLRWLTHGHIGTELIWTAIARIAAQSGATPGDVQSIATGHRDIKFRHAIARWLEEHAAEGQTASKTEAPLKFLDWCRLHRSPT